MESRSPEHIDSTKPHEILVRDFQRAGLINDSDFVVLDAPRRKVHVYDPQTKATREIAPQTLESAGVDVQWDYEFLNNRNPDSHRIIYAQVFQAEVGNGSKSDGSDITPKLIGYGERELSAITQVERDVYLCPHIRVETANQLSRLLARSFPELDFIRRERIIGTDLRRDYPKNPNDFNPDIEYPERLIHIDKPTEARIRELTSEHALRVFEPFILTENIKAIAKQLGAYLLSELEPIRKIDNKVEGPQEFEKQEVNMAEGVTYDGSAKAKRAVLSLARRVFDRSNDHTPYKARITAKEKNCASGIGFHHCRSLNEVKEFLDSRFLRECLEADGAVRFEEWREDALELSDPGIANYCSRSRLAVISNDTTMITRNGDYLGAIIPCSHYEEFFDSVVKTSYAAHRLGYEGEGSCDGIVVPVYSSTGEIAGYRSLLTEMNARKTGQNTLKALRTRLREVGREVRSMGMCNIKNPRGLSLEQGYRLGDLLETNVQGVNRFAIANSVNDLTQWVIEADTPASVQEAFGFIQSKYKGYRAAA